MWILTQNKQRIINSDQIIDIFVARTAPVLYANTTDDADNIVLGEYKDKDTCLKVLRGIALVVGTKLPTGEIPLGGDVETWQKEAEQLYTLYIQNDFKH